MAEIHVFTCAAANYLPKVRVLFASLADHQPHWRRHLVLVEDDTRTLDPSIVEAHEVHGLSELQIPDWRPWSFGHQLVELATAVKPFALARLLARDAAAAVVYLDPDTALFSPLGEIEAGFEDASLLLTPHQLAPETAAGRVIDNEIASLRHGVYNLGFIGVAADGTGAAFAEWWCQRLYRFCRDDVAAGLFTDQRWIDLVPALFPAVAVLRSPRLNAASWNLSQRALNRDNGQFCVGDEALGFYHFTSVDSQSHELQALKNSDNPPALRELLAWYREAQRPLDGASEWTLRAYADGVPVPDAHRRIYRDDPALQRRYPDPWAGGLLREELESRAARGEGERVAVPAVVPGFAGAEEALDPDKLGRLLRAMLTDPRLGAALARRALQVLGREGVGGVLRRLR